MQGHFWSATDRGYRPGGLRERASPHEQRASAEEAYRDELEEEWQINGGRQNPVPRLGIQKKRTKPLLMIHLIDVRSNGLDVPPRSAGGCMGHQLSRHRKGGAQRGISWSTPRGSGRTSAMMSTRTRWKAMMGRDPWEEIDPPSIAGLGRGSSRRRESALEFLLGQGRGRKGSPHTAPCHRLGTDRSTAKAARH